MIYRLSRLLLQGLMLALCCIALRAHAEPYLAVQMGLKCGQCHVNPTGGGLRTTYGDVFAQTLMPHEHIDTGTDSWTGDVTRFLRVGGDLRFDGLVTAVPHTKTTNTFSLSQARVYLEANVIPERLMVYVDEQVAPNGALNREAYGVYWSANHDWLPPKIDDRKRRPVDISGEAESLSWLPVMEDSALAGVRDVTSMT